MADEDTSARNARARSLAFSGAIGAGIGGSIPRMVAEGLPGRKAPRVAKLFTIPMALAGGVAGVADRQFELNALRDPNTKRQIIRSGGKPSVKDTAMTAKIGMDKDEIDSDTQAFSDGAIKAHTQDNQELLHNLFSHIGEMKSRAESQLGGLFEHKGEGHSRTVGATAAEAASMFRRVFGG